MHQKINDNTNLITVFYLNIKSSIQSYNLGKSEWKGNAEVHPGLLNLNGQQIKKIIITICLL